MPENTTLASDGPDRTEWKAQLSPDHWSVFLRCTICFGFLENPHTLVCGHSFCKRCLKRLAEIAREDSPTLSIRRLTLTCPTCRHPFRARPAFSGRIRTCIVLKQLVELWKRECKEIATTSIQNFRSVGCQVTPKAKKEKDRDRDRDKVGEHVQEPNIAQDDVQEDVYTRMVLDPDHCNIILKRVIESLDELITESTGGPNQAKSDSSPAFVEGDRRDQSDSELSAASSSSDANVGGSSNNPSLSNISLPERLSRVGLPRMVYLSPDNCPGRLLLMGVWSIYSLVIVALAEASLPYVILFTLFFFLLVLR